MPADGISLSEAATRLGVHYQTAYKWARAGRLPATRVRGAYELDPADVEAFAARRDRPTDPPARRPRQGFGTLAGRLHDHLLAGEEPAARRLVAGLVDNGVSATEVAQEVLAPAMRRIGEGWHAGDVSIPVEHRATAIAERILGELAPNPRGRRRGRVVVATVTGDRHALATTMAATALRDDNWRVEHLGADVPPADIERFGVDHDVDLYVLTVAVPASRPTAEELVQRLGARGAPVLVGTPGATLTELQAAARDLVRKARAAVGNK